MNPDQRAFILGQVFAMSMMATAQRGQLYSEGASVEERQKLRATLRATLEQVSAAYMNSISDSDHVKLIVHTATTISSAHPKALRAGRFRIGSAQKVLNLYLKYLWCIGEVAMPPHCPFDSIVLAAIPGCQQVRWTQFDSADEYERIVDAAKTIAGGLPLAEWELGMYNVALTNQALLATSPLRDSLTLTSMERRL